MSSNLQGSSAHKSITATHGASQCSTLSCLQHSDHETAHCHAAYPHQLNSKQCFICWLDTAALLAPGLLLFGSSHPARSAVSLGSDSCCSGSNAAQAKHKSEPSCHCIEDITRCCEEHEWDRYKVMVLLQQQHIALARQTSPRTVEGVNTSMLSAAQRWMQARR